MFCLIGKTENEVWFVVEFVDIFMSDMDDDNKESQSQDLTHFCVNVEVAKELYEKGSEIEPVFTRASEITFDSFKFIEECWKRHEEHCNATREMNKEMTVEERARQTPF